MPTAFFDCRGVVHYEYAPQGTTITTRRSCIAFVIVCDANDLTCGQRQLGSSITIMHPPILHIWLRRSWPNSIAVVRQAPYSRDMAPCDFWLFPKLKMPLEEARFESREDIMRNATAQLNTIPKDAFQQCFQQWRDRWISVCITMGTTLKEIRVNLFYMYFFSGKLPPKEYVS
jgi:hypothetical protein